MSTAFDRRVTAARPDLAAAHLKGKVVAERFVEGRVVQASRATADLRRAPDGESGLETQILYGERFTVYEEKNGWAWGQAALDSYVGYARADSFSDRVETPTHRVTALSTLLLSDVDVKKPARGFAPFNAKLTVAEAGERFLRLGNGLYVFAGHVAPIASHVSDWMSVAERFETVPYYWGGKTAGGIDCSGLIQTTLEAGGIASPRDTDMMEAALGTALPLDAELKRGDLIFWRGHVGAMLDATRLIHANGFFMDVTVEPLAVARVRIEAGEGLPVRTIKRL